jgi:outer membrane biosynthesis protein TonB
MRPRFLGILILSAGSVLSAQPLTCPPVTAASGRPCEYHFHVSMYRPESRTSVELYGINHFATQSACDAARDAAAKRNAAVVAHMRPIDNNYKADVFGECHCDMTVEKNSPNFLTDAMRTQQIRTAEEIRLRVRERLLDTNVPSDSELVRGLDAPPSPSPFLGGAKLTPLPQPGPVTAVTNSQEDLKLTKAIDSTAPRSNSIDELALVDVAAPGVAPASPEPASAVAASTTTTTPVAAKPQPQPVAPPPAEPLPSVTVAAPPPPEPAPASETLATTSPAATPSTETAPVQAPAPAPAPAPQPVVEAAAAPAEQINAEDAADQFISVESQRVNNIIAAAGAITDSNQSTEVIQACTERNWVLSNLRSLIIGAGSRSRLAAAAAKAHDESERLAFVAKLFGSDMPHHWAPKDAVDASLKTPADYDAEKILRDSNAPLESRKRALYLLLARTQPAEDQQMSLITIIDGFLQ